MNKKGLVDRSWHWFISMIILTITTFTILTGIYQWEQSLVETPDLLDERLIAHRLVNTPECLAVTDEERIYSGRIDTQKVATTRIASCLGEVKTQYWIRILDGEEELETIQTSRMERTRNTFVSHGVSKDGSLLRIEVEAR